MAAAGANSSALLRRAGAEGPTAPAGDGLQSRTPPDFTVLDLEVEGDKRIATRFTLFVPNHLAKDERVPLLVLLHGLGETGDSDTGVHAWVERYGLGTAYARLRRPPVTRASRSGSLFSDARLVEINAALAAQPFRGMAVACPYTPNIARLRDPEGALDTYASWIASVVVPRARKEAPPLPGAGRVALDGVSLGGFVGIEVFIRRPEAFGVWGGIQSAFNPARAPLYADKLAAVPALSGKTSVRVRDHRSRPVPRGQHRARRRAREEGPARRSRGHQGDARPALPPRGGDAREAPLARPEAASRGPLTVASEGGAPLLGCRCP